MTYPGLVLLVGVGIGLATFLYYMFAENESENDQRQQYNCADERTSDHYNDWRNSPALSHSGRLNRRNLPNSLMRDNGRGRNHMSKEDISNCSICQFALVESDMIQLQCKHNFHKDCIKKLRSYNPRAVCPNCRRSIAQTT